MRFPSSSIASKVVTDTPPASGTSLCLLGLVQLDLDRGAVPVQLNGGQLAQRRGVGLPTVL